MAASARTSRIKAELLQEDGKIVIRKTCPEHSTYEDVLSVSSEFTRNVVPGPLDLRFQPYGDKGRHKIYAGDRPMALPETAHSLKLPVINNHGEGKDADIAAGCECGSSLEQHVRELVRAPESTPTEPPRPSVAARRNLLDK